MEKKEINEFLGYEDIRVLYFVLLTSLTNVQKVTGSYQPIKGD
jgi:hypothetical protein